VLALLLGNAIGTTLMAAHSTQGPHLGIPQMIQSRAQFGVIGAALPLVAVVITYTLYTAADGVIVRDIVKSVLPVGNDGALMAFGAVTLVIAFVGYELIHRMGAILAVVSLIVLLMAAALLVVQVPPTVRHSDIQDGFSWALFMQCLTQAAAWSLSFGPYVADYSRYLPADVSPKRTFWFTGLGNFLGASLIMCLGAFLADLYPSIAQDPGIGLARQFGRFDYPARILIAVGVLEGNVLNLYSAYMSSTAIYSSVFKTRNFNQVAKFVLLTVLITVATAIAIATQDHFDDSFSDMLSVMVYILVPWSAINLADYYYVQKGVYSVSDLFIDNGIYGKFRWPAIVIYSASIVAQIPFMQVSFYSGPFAVRLGADIAWLPGLTVAALLYCLFARKVEPLKAALSPLEAEA